MSEYKWKPFTLLVSAEEVKGNEMKIEAGKYYKTRDGRKVGPLIEKTFRWDNGKWYKTKEIDHGWYPDGFVYKTGTHIHEADLISEWQDEAPSPIRTVTRREIVAGVYGAVEVMYHDEGGLMVGISDNNWNASELREAAHLLNQIAEVLEENGK